MDQTPPHLPYRGEPDYDSGMEGRVAVLEQIAKDTRDVLTRMDTRMDRMEDRQSADFKWLFLLGLGATSFLFAALGHGFRWF
jgi:hypothetical protein